MIFEVELAFATWKHAIYVIRATVGCLDAIMYLQDTSILSQTTKKHVEQLYIVSEPSGECCLTLKLKRNLSFTDSISYLGRPTRSKKLQVETETTDEIRGFQSRISTSQLRSPARDFVL